MFNNFYKTIHNKYSRFFKFIFFIRYLFIIFFISTVLFVSLPIFFNYEKKAEIIKLHILKNYNFKVINYEKIKYNVVPIPNLELNNVQLNFESSKENLSAKKIKIYLNFMNIYNYKNFNSNKITIQDGDIKFQASNFYYFSKYLFYQKNKLNINNLNLKVIDKNIPIVTLDNIKFANYGYNENLITGKIFGKNFKVNIDNNFKDINFKLLNSGINLDINFDQNQKETSKSGIIKLKILNTNYRSNFEYDSKAIKIYNSYFRSKNISFKNKSEIIFQPFLETNSKFIIEKFNSKILKKIDLTKLHRFSDFFKKINNKSEIVFQSKKFNNKIFDDLNLKINLSYGRMNFSKNLSGTNYTIQCDGNMNFLEEFPKLYFNCSVKSDNKKEFLKKFSIKIRNKNEILELKFKGNLNVSNGKINFKNVSMNNDYEASKEDLKYYKESFENILFDKNFSKMIDFSKLKKFLIEIS